ncbi:dihydroxyacetone kinase subunit DhaL [Cohaesibacter celericrescens]|uniref:dihydroxyacetone kinase subunit DhaL n=1 Tax=Cohaesibacter celericrescens TaxID=2067669 RepID=UPI00356AD009
MTTLTKGKFVQMLRTSADIIKERHQSLSELDSATGDGDHGVTINRTMQAVVKALDENAGKPFAELLKAVAMGVMMCDGGSTSPLLGSYFLGLASGAVADTLTATQTAAMFEAGLANFRKTSKADLGDKTMVDAFDPATEALVRALGETENHHAAFELAAAKAKEGAEKTSEYVAKFGRARTMGERAIGHLDPGAKSISYIFEGFSKAC